MTWIVLLVGPLLLLGLALALMPPRREGREVWGVLEGLWWVNRFYTGFWHRLEVVNQAPLPLDGSAILISNHTCGIDHLILQAGTRRVLGFMVAQEYYDHKLYGPFCKVIGCIPVKRDGKDSAAVRAAMKAVRDGRVLPIFPEGRINPHSGRDFLEPKSGAAFMAMRAKVPVIPAYIQGTPATSNIGRSLGTPSHARLMFGAPVDLSDLEGGEDHGDNREHLKIATERLMAAIKALRDQSPPSA